VKKKTDIMTRLAATPTEHYEEAITEIRRLRRELSIVKSGTRVYRISKASDAECAATKECYSALVSIDSKKKWMEDRDLFVADGRAFALVDTHTGVYFMDAITGSLYNFGECMTSVHGRTGFVRDREKAMNILMQLRAVAPSGGTGGIDDADV
jgi:hypothetical protein